MIVVKPLKYAQYIFPYMSSLVSSDFSSNGQVHDYECQKSSVGLLVRLNCSVNWHKKRIT